MLASLETFFINLLRNCDVTDSPLIKGFDIFSLEEVFVVDVKAWAKEGRCRTGGATTMTAEIGGVEGEDIISYLLKPNFYNCLNYLLLLFIYLLASYFNSSFNYKFRFLLFYFHFFNVVLFYFIIVYFNKKIIFYYFSNFLYILLIIFYLTKLSQQTTCIISFSFF